ncbi:MAG: SDR family oxidoreductase [Caulobacterales bacterium]
MVADLLEGPARETVGKIKSAGGSAHFEKLDVSDAAAWKEISGRVVQELGGIDILVNNAGIDMSATIESATFENFQKILSVNLFGAFHGMQAVIPYMKERGGGSIVNLASAATRLTIVTSAMYTPAKAAVASLTKVAALHCAQQRYNIRINSIHPGPIETDMLFGGDAKRGDSPDIQGAIAMVPLGRLGQGDDIGAVVVFLASDQSRYMTGQEVFVDGGLSML